MPRSGNWWAKTARFDVFALDGTVTARNVTAQQAATMLGVSVPTLELAIANFSYLDAGGFRAAGHMSISRGTS
jgi:hypothetical protein